MISHGHFWFVSLVLLAAFAIANRLFGAADKDGRLHLKALAIGLTLAATAALHWPLLIFALGWFAWRSPPNGLFGASLAPKNGSEILRTFLRHAVLSAPGFLGGALAVGAPWWAGAAVVASFAAGATSYAVTNRAQADQGRDVNWLIEPAVGLTFGLAVLVLVALS